jgi:hypothetical protein
MSSFNYTGQYNTSTGLFAADTTGSGGGTPIGTIIMFGAATPPTNYLLCDGTAYAKGGIYSQLYAVIGETFGVDGANFKVPNLTGKMPAGRGGSTDLADTRQMPTGAIGAVGGADNGLALLPLVAIPDHHHTFAGTGTATMDAHDHAFGTIDYTQDAHDHAFGTISYTQAAHDHAFGTIAYTQAAHDHAFGTIAYTQAAHDHAFGTIDYIQDAHSHNMTHLHTLSAHTHSAPVMAQHRHGMPHTHPMPHRHGMRFHTHASAAMNPHNHDHQHLHQTQAHTHPIGSGASGTGNNYMYPFYYYRAIGNSGGGFVYSGDTTVTRYYPYSINTSFGNAPQDTTYGDVLATDNTTSTAAADTGTPSNNVTTEPEDVAGVSVPNTAGSGAGNTSYETSTGGDTGVADPDTTGASSFSLTGNKTATGTMSGDTATAVATGTMAGDTATAVATGTMAGDTATAVATGTMAGDTATAVATGTMSGDTAMATTTGTVSVLGDVGAMTTTADAAVTQTKFAPPFLSLTFCIRYQET